MSMRAHRYSMNGRLVVHTLVQIFGMLPMWFFDIVNAGVFALQIALVHKIAMGSLPRSNGMLLAVFSGVWLFCPVFGQVNLWQDGAVNYLWGTVLALAMVPALVSGVCDIADTYQRMKANEAYIYKCRENGMMDIEVPIILSETDYSVANGGRYLKEDPTTWPNEAMAVYYEINSLTGFFEH